MKTCSICKVSKKLTSFGKLSRSLDGLKHACKDCLGKRAIIEKAKARRIAFEFLINWCKNNPCPCGESRFICLEFDHVDPSTKKEAISKMVSRAYGIESIKQELDKCQVLCSNCHKIKTAKEQGWYKDCVDLL